MEVFMIFATQTLATLFDPISIALIVTFCVLMRTLTTSKLQQIIIPGILAATFSEVIVYTGIRGFQFGDLILQRIISHMAVSFAVVFILNFLFPNKKNNSSSEPNSYIPYQKQITSKYRSNIDFAVLKSLKESADIDDNRSAYY